MIPTTASRAAAQEAISRLGAGDHLCCIYRDRSEQMGIVVPYLVHGLQNNERCLYIIDESTREEVFHAFGEVGVALNTHTASGQFLLLTKAEAYLKEGNFDPDRMIATLKQVEANALKEGYAGLRITGEMTWIFSGLPGVEGLIEYESKLNLFFPSSKSTAICQYHEARFDPDILIDVIHTHPAVVIYGQVCENPYYIPPDEFLLRMKSSKIPLALYEKVRDDIIARAGLEADRHRLESELRVALDRSERTRRALLSTLEDQKQAAQELVESKALTEAVVENIPLMIFLKEAADLRFVVFNRAGEELLGYDRKALLGKSNLDLFPPEQAAHFMAKDREVLDGDAGFLDIPEEPILTAKKGERLLHTRKICIRGNDGETKYLLGISEDITERKQAEAEREKLQAQFTQAQKMESVGRLAGGVAHDFNNMLMIMMNYAQLCMDKVGPGHPIREWLDEILKVAERSTKLTHQLLAFARKQVIAPKVIDLNDAIGSMLKLLRRLIGEDVAINWRPGSDVWPVKMDPVQIDQILANLAVNARDAIGGVGSIVIETGNIVIDESYCAAHAESLPGGYAVITVTDSGAGMNAETLKNIFEPFFTTKGEGEGTGLGLATVYGIVKQNNGFINVYSEPGHGTTFKIHLPRVAGTEAVQAGTVTAAKPPHGTETVLLVEDEKSIRITMHLFLEDLGYTLLAAEDPTEALRLSSEHPGEIDLLITDVVMPGMSGCDLAQRLSELRPSIQCLFISGFTADVIAQRGILDDGVNFLSKPFGRDALARKVREVLEGGVKSPRPPPSIPGEAS